MNSQNPFPSGDSCCGPNNDMTVDQLLGNAYQVVKFVAMRMPFIKTLSDNIADIIALADSLDALKDIEENLPALLALQAEMDKLTVLYNNLVSLVLVADNMNQVLTVHDNLPQIQEVVDNLAQIQTVATNIAQVVAVGNNIAAVNGVYANMAAVLNVNTNITAVADVSTHMTDVRNVSNNMAAVQNVHNNMAEILALFSDMAVITQVAGSLPAINNVNDNMPDINTVAGIAADIGTVAENVASINNFSDVYLGAKTSDPSTRNDGSALQTGDLYFNVPVGEMRAFTSSNWVSTGSTVDGLLKRPPGDTPIIATAGQTVVPVAGGYDSGNVLVLVNGVSVSAPEADTSSGTDIVFATPLSSGDKVDYFAYGAFLVADTFTKGELQAPTGATQIGYKTSSVATVLDSIVDAKQFGAVGNGVADDTAALRALAAAPAGRKRIPSGTYKVNLSAGSIEFQPGDLVEGDGDTTIIDASGNVTSTNVLSVRGTMSALPNLSATATKGSVQITFASAPNVAPGDVILIYNPADYSWSTWRPMYCAGEYCRVHSVSGNTVKLMAPLWDSYVNTSVSVYKMNGASTKFRDFRIKQAPTQNAGLFMEYIDRPIVDNVLANGSTYCGIEIARSVDIDIRGGGFQASTPTDDEYGVCISNCHGGRVDGTFYGGRHAVAVGGGVTLGSVSVRDITFTCPIMGNNAPIGAQDLHGNSEGCTFIGGTFSNGGILAGANHKFIGCTFKGNLNSGVALYGGEIVGGNFIFDSCVFETYANPNVGGYGILDFSQFSVNTTRSVNLFFTDCFITSAVSVGFAVNLVLTGTAQEVNCFFNGVRFGVPGATSFYRLKKTTGTGNFGYITLRDIDNFPAVPFVSNGGGYTVYRYRMPEQYGSVTVPSTTSSSISDIAITFPSAYPIAPTIFVSGTSSIVGGKRVISTGYSESTTGAVARISTADGTSFASVENAPVRWRAILD